MKMVKRKLISILIGAVMVFSSLTVPVFAAGRGTLPLAGGLVTTSYRLLNTSAQPLWQVSKGQTVNIELRLKNTDVKTSAAGTAADLDITKLLDSFTGGDTPVAVIESSGDDPLVLRVLFPNVTYSGVGNSFKFMVGYKKLAVAYDSGDVTIRECVEYVAPTLPPEQPAPAPVLLISRTDSSEPVQAGQSFTVTVQVKNVGRTAISSVIATFTPSDSLMLTESSFSVPLPNLGTDNYATVTLHLKALEEIASPAQSLSVEVKYAYLSMGGMQQGSSSEKIPIAAVVKSGKDSAVPLIQIGRNDIGKAINAGEKFTVTVWFKNLGDTAVTSPFVTFTTTESLMLLSNTPSAVLPTLQPGETAKVKLRLKALNAITTPVQSINVDMKFNYAAAKAVAQGTASEKIIIPTVSSDSQSASTPNVIISKYSYGEGQVAAGSGFSLSLDFTNTSRTLDAENIVMTLDAAEGLSIASSANTFYYSSLAAGETKNQTIQMQALSGGKSMSPIIDITFKYEFVDQGKRTPVTISEKISIPVYQPDRFEVTAPVIPEAVPAGQEFTLSLTYVNKGKSDASNVAAFIEGNINALSLTQNLGNFEPGKSGTIDFIIKPEEVGEANFVIKVTYENASMQTVTREFPIKLTVEEPIVEPDPNIPSEPTDEPAKSGISWVWWAAGGAVALAVVVFFLVRRKRNAAKANRYVWEEEETEGEDHEKK